MFDARYDSYRRVVRYVRVVAGRLDDQLVYRKRLRRPVAEYTHNLPPHVQAAREARPPRAPGELRGDEWRSRAGGDAGFAPPSTIAPRVGEREAWPGVGQRSTLGREAPKSKGRGKAKRVTATLKEAKETRRARDAVRASSPGCPRRAASIEGERSAPPPPPPMRAGD